MTEAGDHRDTRRTVEGIRVGWRQCYAEDIASKGKSALATGPFGSAIGAKHFVSDGVPVIRGGNLSTDIGVRIVDDGFVFLTDDKASEFGRSTARAGDLIFTCWGTINQVGLIDERAKYSEYIISNKQMKLTVDQEMACPLYLYYHFSGPEKQQEISGNSIGAAVPGFNLGQLRRMELYLPPRKEQAEISAVLASLDDKIALLHRQNKTLEAMAETLFRQWFVEEADEIWESCTVGEVLTVKGGTTPSTSEPGYWDGAIPWTTPRDLSDQRSVYLFDTIRKITPLGLAQIGSGLLPAGTVLLSSRAPIGYLAIADIPMAVNQGYIAIVCDDGIPNYYAYLWCKHQMGVIKSAGNGSTFEEISKSSFKALTFQVPPTSKLEAFDGIAASIFEKLRANGRQACNLQKLRDTLLPKLMSGEVRVVY